MTIMNKLICSFKSDLPNEIDFAMQVATLLANTDNFIWSKDHQLIDAICSSLHVFVCVCGDTPTCYCYARFWHKILITHANNQYLHAATVPPDIDQCYLNFATLQDHDAKDQAKIYKRIRKVSELILQFSLTIGTQTSNNTTSANLNDYLLAKKKKVKVTPSLLKFVCLLLHCDDMPLNMIGFDILSNTASKLSKIPDTNTNITCAKLLQMFQDLCVDAISRPDGDIYTINRSMEVVSKLVSSSSKQVSSNIIKLIIEKNIVMRIEQFLTSPHNVTLFLSALECCYRISLYQPHLITNGQSLTGRRSRYLMKILVKLLNCDDSRYFTPSALKRIKLVDEDDAPVYNLMPLVRQHTRVAPQVVRHSGDGDKKTAVAQTQPPPPPPEPEFYCRWHECDTKFSCPKQVYDHVFESHVGPIENNTLTSCQWSGPKGSGPGCLTKRPKYSLLTHLNDFHCNQLGLTSPEQIKPPEHPGYAANAALLAIKRHANAQQDNQKQSPLGVSVRLTAAMILKNLASDSPEMKQALEIHEPLLSEICMTNGRDESKILAECLSLISRD